MNIKGRCFYVPVPESRLFLLSVNRWLSTSSLFTSHFRQQMALTRRYNIRVFFAMLLEGAARRRPREPSRVKRIIKDFAPRKCTCRTTFLKASSINFAIMVELLIYFIFLFFFKCMFVNARFFFFFFGSVRRQSLSKSIFMVASHTFIPKHTHPKINKIQKEQKPPLILPKSLVFDHIIIIFPCIIDTRHFR